MPGLTIHQPDLRPLSRLTVVRVRDLDRLNVGAVVDDAVGRRCDLGVDTRQCAEHSCDEWERFGQHDRSGDVNKERHWGMLVE